MEPSFSGDVVYTYPLWVGWSEGGPLVLGMMHSGPGGEGGGVGVLGSVTETPTETRRFQRWEFLSQNDPTEIKPLVSVTEKCAYTTP